MIDAVNKRDGQNIRSSYRQVSVASLAVLCAANLTIATEATANPSITAFADHCFSPLLTAAKAAEIFGPTGARYDFYDLDPFSNVALSPATGAPATPGTDRRCEVSFDGAHSTQAAEAAVGGLQAEGILTDAPLPDTHHATPGTALLAARQLNPKRIAVVHVGTRPGPNGIETFLNVERLLPMRASN